MRLGQVSDAVSIHARLTTASRANSRGEGVLVPHAQQDACDCRVPLGVLNLVIHY